MKTELSYGQEALWFDHQVNRDNRGCTLAALVEIRSPFDVAAMRRVQQALIERHPIYRTRYFLDDNQLTSEIAEEQEVDFEVIDVAGWPDAKLEAAWREEYLRPFDLERDRLLRHRIWRRSPTEHFWQLIYHHLVTDGFTFWLLLDEFRELYPRAVSGLELPPAPPHGAYSEFVKKQRALVEGPKGQKLAEYWVQKLQGVPQTLEMPTDFPRPQLANQAGGCFSWTVPAALHRELQQLATSRKTTLFTLLLAAYQVLLFRWTGQNDFVVGSPVTGRPGKEFERTHGYFANLLAIRSECDSSVSFEDFWTATRGNVFGAFKNAAYPFSCLLKDLPGERLGLRPPLAQAAFVFQKAHLNAQDATILMPGAAPQPFDLGGLEVVPRLMPGRHTVAEFTFELAESEQTLTATVSYQTALFRESTVKRLADYYLELLKRIVANPAEPIGRLRFCAPSELGVDHSPPAQPKSSLLEALHRAAKNHALKPAITGERELTYEAVFGEAFRLARYLKKELKVESEDRVGVYLRRSPEAVISALAILFAGGVYVPLDPEHPARRLHDLIEESGVKCILGKDPLPSGDTPFVAWQSGHHQVWSRRAEFSFPSLPATHAAYMIFTSGTTGRPKGVVGTHGGVWAMLQGLSDRYEIDSTTRMLHLSSLNFDASLVELLAPLLRGGTLVIPSAVGLIPGPGVTEAIRTHRVTHLPITPSGLAMLVPEDVPSETRLIVAGEAFPTALAEVWRSRCRVINGYGPTETSIGASVSTEWLSEEPPPIGSPLAGARLYVLDGALQPVPIGVPGELFIGGNGVTRGYHNRPDLTAERFLPDPFTETPGARMYRTGDRVRWREDRQLDFLGRTDTQIKLRGLRIEPGEIEAILEELPAVRQAVVVAREIRADPVLVAFVVLRKSENISTTEMKESLRTRLPSYLVPARIEVLESMPLSANGKIDRRALISLPIQQSVSETIAPQTLMEKRLAEIWLELLPVAEIHRDADFFALGGHSLLATQVIVRLQQMLGLDVAETLRSFFTHPTLAGFASELERLQGTAVGPGLQKVEARACFPLSYAQRRLWFLHQLQPNSASYNVPVAIRLQGKLPEAALREALEAVLRRHSALRTRFRTEGTEPVQEIVESAELPWRAESLKSDQEANETIRQFILQPFELATAPMVRALLVRRSATKSELICNFHHIAFDGWCVPIFLKELLENIDTLVAGGAVQRGEPEFRYVDFAVWEHLPLQETRWTQTLEFFREKIADLPPLQLPLDFRRPTEPGGLAGRHVFHLPKALTPKLKSLAAQTESSLYAVLLAAGQIMLSRWSGQERFPIGIAVANRHQEGLQDLIGFFVNTLVLGADLGESPTFLELLARVRETLRESLAHQELPFERLVEAVQPERSLHNPLFNVACVLQQSQPEAYAMKHFAAELFFPDVALARLDLELHWIEHGDRLSCGIMFDADLFRPNTIERFAEQYETLLHSILETPEAPIRQLNALPEQERLVLEEWSASSSQSGPQHFLERFDAVVAKRSHEIALVRVGTEITYGELDRRANSIAHSLMRRGIGPESRVGIMMARRPEVVIAMLGTMKAGAAYVPLNSDYPSERLRFLLENTGCQVVLSDRPAPADLALSGVRWLQPKASESAKPPANLRHPELAAYAMYTSGSTGKPKGVVISQAALCASMLSMCERFKIGESCRFVQNASLSFDVSVLEIFSALWAGGSVVFLEPGEQQPGTAFVEAVNRLRGTHLLLVPSVLAALPSVPRLRLKTLIAGAEPLPAALSVAMRSPERDFFNAYGPTEAAICTVATNEWDDREAPPIGRPVSAARIFLLDDALRPVPIGAQGELYIGGPMLARGYLDAPALTAERFVPNPFAHGERLYRTGDLARWRTDGQIEYLGRTDEQVKLRGMRIELGEIEAALRSIPLVREAAVVLSDQNDSLSAHLVLAKEESRAETDRVEEWQRLYDEVMEEETPVTDATFDITGWNSSYTGEPIPEAEMREWRDRTVECILGLTPKRVLEIGCGTGLLLFPIAPGCETYAGLDFSSASLARLAHEARRRSLTQVALFHRRADEVEQVPGEFDVVVLNSVIQYFPSEAYLRDVLGKTLAKMTAGGSIFLGDVRHLPLLAVQHASVQFTQAPPELTREMLAENVERALALENELAFSPAFFRRLPEHFPQISAVEIRWRPHTFANELSKFRFDVVLRIGSSASFEYRPPSQVLSAEVSKALARDLAIFHWLSQPGPATVGELGSILEERELRSSDDAMLEDHEPSALANNPMRQSDEKQAIETIQAELQQKLPAALIPSRFFVLDRLPFTSSGKLDRLKLRAQAGSLKQAPTNSAPPSTPMERQIAAVWSEFLQTPEIGRNDSFFSLGGHSLLATRVIGRLQTLMPLDVSRVLKAFFANPTLAEFAKMIEGMSEVADDEIHPRDPSLPAPLSYAQQRLWFLDKLYPGQTLYHVPFGMRFRRAIAPELVRLAFQAILDRHEALRTSFQSENSTPRQRIHPHLEFELPRLVLPNGADPETWLDAQAFERLKEPMDLTKGPMFRAAWLDLGPAHTVVIGCFHHIVFDGWSLPVFVRDFLRALELAESGRPVVLEALPIQYADFAAWEQSNHQEKRWLESINAWKEELRDLPSLNLPIELDSAATGVAGKLAFEFPPGLGEQLKRMSQENGTTLFVTLLSAFQLVLSRWTGQTDFPVGTGVANRHQQELHELIGFFVNSLVLRADLSGDPTCTEALLRAKTRCQWAFAHQELPFERLVQELHPERNARNPLFQVAFLLQDEWVALEDLKRAGIEPYIGNWTTTRMELELHILQAAGELSGLLYYDRGLFAPETIERLVSHLQTVLERFVTAPDTRLSELPLLAEGERHKVLVDWNRPEETLELPILKVLALTVQQFPNHIALESATESIPYQELDRLSSCGAARLVEAGVQPGAHVGLAMERTPAAVVAMLAVLKAGATYVPLDPAHPADRLGYLRDDAELSLLIVDAEPPESLASMPLFAWSAADLETEGTSRALPPPSLGAYLIYTSGSTGQPKGVVATHASLGHVARALAEVYHLHPNARVLQLASLSFDASVAEIYMALAAGATLVFPAAEVGRTGSSLLQAVRKQAITHLQITPSALSLLPVEPWPALEALIVVGEAFPRELATQWTGKCRVINGYGPTEGTICATTSETWAPGEVPPIGRPIPRVQVYILDDRLQPVAVGTSGELYIGGSGVAQGYWKRPELTAQRFLPDPFQRGRLYRTGDLVRWRSDGQIDFLGRVDRQVKIRGQRVELGEIEAALTALPGVQEAAVVLRNEEAAAFIVPSVQSPELIARQVADWQRLYDDLTEQPEAAGDPTFNITGWNESYDAKPIPPEAMRAWQEEIVGRICSARPMTVLEIGCGTGLMLFPLAPLCKAYWGTDFSGSTLKRLESVVANRKLKNVRLLHRMADEFQELPEAFFDTVILNSVVQYFPTLDYLLLVLGNALRLVKKGGAIFLGDVRNLELLRVFHASIEAHRGPETLTPSELKMRVDARGNREEELLLSPEFFRTLGTRFPEISEIQLQWRTSELVNELTKYRFDVLIRKRSKETPTPTRFLTPSVPSLQVAQTLAEEFELLRWIDSGEPRSATTLEAFRRHVVAQAVPQKVADSMLGLSDAAKPLSNRPLRIHLEREWVPELKIALRGVLPEALIPREIVLLDAMPLTSAGKLDYRALPEIPQSRPTSGESEAKVQNALEDLVAEVYAEVLELESVDRDANFFELGGHSLSAYTLVELLRQRVGYQLPLAAFFAGPTVRELAEKLAQGGGPPEWSPLVPIQTRGKKRPLFVTPPIMGTVFPYFELSKALGTSQPFYGLQPRGLDGRQTPHASLEAMAAEFIEAMKGIQPKGPYRLAGWSFGAVVAYEMTVQLEAAGESVELLIAIDGALPNVLSAPATAIAGIADFFFGTVRHLGGYVRDYFYLLSESQEARRTFQKGPAAQRGLWKLFGSAALGRVVPKESRLLLLEQPLVSGMLRVFRANIKAINAYYPGKIESPLLLITTGGRTPIAEGAAATWRGCPNQRRELVRAEHLTLLRSPHVKQLAEFIERALALL